MSTRLGILCNRIIEAGWLVALIVTPLYFNSSSSRVFEADKAILLRSLAVLVGLVWAIKGGDAWLARRRRPSGVEAETSEAGLPDALRASIRQPILLGAALLLVSHLLATVFSILPEVSIWGQYERLQGMYTMASYMVFFFSVVALLRTSEQLQRIITAVLLVSIPVALYGIMEHFGVRLWPWAFDVQARVISTMGNAIFLAAFFMLAIPLTVYRLIETRQDKGSWLRLSAYLVLLVLQLLCMVYTQSRGPVLGLAFGVLFGGLLWTLARHQWGWAKTLIGSSAAFAALLVVINLPNTPLAFVQDIPIVNRLALIANAEGSSLGRVLMWEGAVDLASKDPARLVLGYGPEAIRYAFYPHHTAEIGHLEGWGVVPDRLHNAGLDVLFTTGVVGVLAYLLLFTSIVYYGFRWIGVMASTRARTLFLMLWFSGPVVAIVVFSLLSQSWTFTGIGVALGFIGGALLYLAGYAFLASRQQGEEAPASKPRLLLLVFLFSSLIAHFVEINVGIGVTVTQLYFWMYTGLFVVVGLQYLVWGVRPEVISVTSGGPDQPAAQRIKPSASKRSKKRKPQSKQRPSVSRWRPVQDNMLVPGLMVGLILGTIVFSFMSFQVADANLNTVRGFVLASWLLVGGAMVVELYGANKKWPSVRSVLLYALGVWLPALFYIILKDVGTGGGLFHLVLYAVLVLLVLVILAVGLLPGQKETTRLRKSPVSSYVLGGALTVGAFLLIYQTNIQVVQANIYYNVAKSALQQKRYDVAITQYRNALALDPRQGRYQLELAQALASKAVFASSSVPERERLFQDAEAILKEAVVANPYEPYNRAQLSEVYRAWAMVTPDASRRNDRTLQAISYLEDALQYNKQNILFLRKWAELHEGAGNEAQALANYRELLRWDSTNVDLYLDVGNRYRAGNQWQEAATMYEGAIRHASSLSPEAHRLLAEAYQHLERLDDALLYSKEAYDLDQDDPANHKVLIDLYQRTDQCVVALRYAREALQRWPDYGDFQTQVAQLECP